MSSQHSVPILGPSGATLPSEHEEITSILTKLNLRADAQSSSALMSHAEDTPMADATPRAIRKRKSSPKTTPFQRKKPKARHPATQPVCVTTRVSVGSSWKAKGKQKYRSPGSSSDSPDFNGVESIIKGSQTVSLTSASASQNVTYAGKGRTSSRSTQTSVSARMPSKIFLSISYAYYLFVSLSERIKNSTLSSTSVSTPILSR
jgi:hypothetical protein